MSPPPPVDVAASGAVLLGDRVCCDGYRRGYPVRVQTHVHLDHMADFNRSKGEQDICLSDATRRLLTLEQIDLPYHINVHSLPPSQPRRIADTVVTLVPSGHMLGSVQVRVELPDGRSAGYSGDFAWPLDNVIRVDELVVDSTYGSPRYKREYDQAAVEARFLELVLRQLVRGPINLIAHRGTLQRAMQLLTAHIDCPMVGSGRLTAEAAVYRDAGYGINPVLPNADARYRDIVATQRYVHLFGTGDRHPVDPVGCSTIVLSAFMSNPREPVLAYSEASFRVAMSNHADFVGTLEYIQATGAMSVITDNTRGGHAVELATEIRSRLGVEARPSTSGSIWE